MTEFETLLQTHQGAVERFVKFRISSKQDAEDILQETYLTAFRKFHTLRDREQFKAWLLAIARNKCNDFYRSHRDEVPLEEVAEPLAASRWGRTEPCSPLELVNASDRQLLYLFYLYGASQGEIAARLDIPVGTVKSRLYTARTRLKAAYLPEKTKRKDDTMKRKLPEIMPEYTIEKIDKAPFPVKWEEMMGWFIVPKLGEKRCWAAYDFPEKKRSEYVELKAVGKAKVHGIEGVEIASRTYDPEKDAWEDGAWVAQLTEDHCRYLSEWHMEDGVKVVSTFLDGDEFLRNWGFGPDNCGNETNLSAKREITRQGSTLTAADKPFLLDIVGRYEVVLNGKTYDTVCLVFIDPVDGALTEQYLDERGRTVLWRRFNPDNWCRERYGKPWTEILTDNERITVNGETYVHWYDCITDYIL